MTNKHFLPLPIVKAVSLDRHKTIGEISVTGLIDSPQIRILKKKHKVEVDASELIFALLGTSVHSILERAHVATFSEQSYNRTIEILEEKGHDKEAKNLIKIKPVVLPPQESEMDRYEFEKTMSQDIDGMQLSGTWDLYDKVDKKLMDYKVCSVYSYIYPESRNKFVAQLNCYVYMMRLQGYEVSSASVLLIFRDWSASKVLLNADYPKQMVMEVPIEIYSEQKMSKYLSERVRLHRAAENGEPVECTAKERWASGDTYAIMASGSKRAVRVLSNENDANNLLNEIKHKYVKAWIEKRPGENKRCASFCSVSNVCPQYKKILNSNQQ